MPVEPHRATNTNTNTVGLASLSRSSTHPTGSVTHHPPLATHQLTHRYADGRVALDDVTFAVEHGECVAIVGPNGAGKTTLFLRLCGVLSGKPGEASVCGLDT